MTDLKARVSPGIKELGALDRLDIFRQVVGRLDDAGESELEVGEHHVRWKIVGDVIAIGLADEFSTPRISDDA